MRRFMSFPTFAFSLVFALGLTAPATPASAQIVWGDDLRFVANTAIPSDTGPLVLCHATNGLAVLSVPVYTRVQGYAVSNGTCDSGASRALAPAEFTALQAAGQIPAALPTTAKASVQDLLWGHAGLIGLGALALLIGKLLLPGGVRIKKGGPDTLAVHSLVAMSQVAIADGRIDDTEVHNIANILTRLTGNAYTAEQVMEMLETLNPSASDLAEVGQELSEKDRQIVLEAALNIAVVDGDIHPNEYAVVSELAQRMRIGADQFRAALARIAAHLQTVPSV